MTRHTRIEDEALDWLIRWDEPGWGPAERSQFEAWLGISMAHKAAFWRAEHGWRETDRIRSLGRTEELCGSTAHPMRRLLPIAASIALALSVGDLRPLRERSTEMPVPTSRFATALGDRQIVPLADGSKVELNTSTVIRTAVSTKSRDIWLDSGEAYFEVAHRDKLAFVVHAGRETVTVLGTKFSVRRDRDRVTVSVSQGRVRVADMNNPSGRAVIITEGDTAIARGSSTLIAGKSEDRVADALAWRHGMLSFDQETLSQVVAEFNRYNRKQVTVVGHDARDIRIGGTFQASNVDAFLRLLRDAYGLRIEDDPNHAKIFD